MFGSRFDKIKKITIALNGDGIRPGQPMRTPYTDIDHGWIHLFRFPYSDFPYQNGLSHELVHALRFEHTKNHQTDRATGFGFIEEGLAEYVSTIVEPSKPGFSTFGVSLATAAGHWVTKNEDIPLPKLLNQFGELDQRCMLQAYVLRSSFISYLDKTYGRNALMKIAFQIKEVNEMSFYIIYKKNFMELVKEWRNWVTSTNNADPTFIKQAAAYQKSFEARKMYVCKVGRDF